MLQADRKAMTRPVSFFDFAPAFLVLLVRFCKLEVFIFFLAGAVVKGRGVSDCGFLSRGVSDVRRIFSSLGLLRAKIWQSFGMGKYNRGAMPSSLSKKVILLVALPLAFELVFVCTLAFMLHTVQEERSKENYARDLTAHVNNALTALLDRFSSCILYHVSDSPAFRRRFDESRRRIEAEIKYLHNAVDDPAHVEERALVSNVETLLQLSLIHI